MNKIQAVGLYTAVNIRLQLQPTKLIGRSKFIIKFMDLCICYIDSAYVVCVRVAYVFFQGLLLFKQRPRQNMQPLRQVRQPLFLVFAVSF